MTRGMTEHGLKLDLHHLAGLWLLPTGFQRLSPEPLRWLFAAFLLLWVFSVWSQTPTAPSAAASGMAESVPAASSSSVASVVPPAVSADPALPPTPALGHSVQITADASSTSAPDTGAWLALSKRQKQALAPLSETWQELTGQQRQKWLVLSRNFFQLTDEEQLTLHSRMREWAALSPRQRSQARFHFNTMPNLSAQDKRAQWEAYQALSEQEKSKLSSGPKPPAKSVARSFAPPSTRLVSPPLLPVNATRAVQRVAPSKPIHPKTLLPQPS
jgi:hypothetical protein